MGLRIAVMSDLHCEFDRALIVAAGSRKTAQSLRATQWLQHLHDRRADARHPPLGPNLRDIQGVDLLLLAGDIDYCGNAVAYAAEAATYCGCPAVLVPGNHEFYGREHGKALAEMREIAAASQGQVHLLDCDRVNFAIAGRRVAVLGATLWTNYRLYRTDVREAMREADHGLQDHRSIRFGKRRFLPMDAYSLNAQAYRWLATALTQARHDADLVIAITHHAVLRAAIPPQYRGSPLSPAFASDLEEELREWMPDLWVYGHTHHPLDTVVGNTRVVSAPRGYIGAEPEAEAFRPMVIRVP